MAGQKAQGPLTTQLLTLPPTGLFAVAIAPFTIRPKVAHENNGRSQWDRRNYESQGRK